MATTWSPSAQLDAAHPVGRAAHRAHVTLPEADGHAVARPDENLAGAVGELGIDDGVVVVHAQGDDAAGTDVAEGAQVGLLDDSLARPHDDVGALLLLGPLAHGQQRRESSHPIPSARD